MDFEVIRFRIDPELHARAAQVCSERGMELNDVLRAVIGRIATERDIAPELMAPRPPEGLRAPFSDYDPRTWQAFRKAQNAELAIEVLARYVARCSARLAGVEPDGPPPQDLIDRLTAERDKALALRRQLDVNDEDAVAEVLRTYGPLTRARAV